MNTLRLMSAALIMVALATAAQAKRVALVIGNSAYQAAAPLPNPANDARAMSQKLQSLGFEIVEGFDLDHDGMHDVFRSFARAARGAEVATVFYAGHGIAVDGKNYLVPVDASLNDPNDWKFQVYPLDDIMKTVKHSAGASLIFVDACRDNPLAGELARSMGKSSRSAASRGLARVAPKRTGKGMVIAFATADGKTASDGEGANSPFTTALLNNLGAANTDITTVMSRVTGEVLETTNQVQRPWVESSLTGSVILNSVAATAAVAVAPDATPAVAAAPVTAGLAPDIEQMMFDAARTSGDAADYRAYLDMFPQGIFAQLANNAIKRAERAASQQVAAVAAPVIQPAVASPVRTTMPTAGLNAPLMLQVTDALRAVPGSQATETELYLTKAQKREVQGRLNALGLNVGGMDGSWGGKTRSGISQWQAQNGLIPTSFLNASQHQLLVANTEIQYRAYAAARPAQTYSSGGGSSKASSTSSPSEGNGTITGSSAGDAVFVGGMAIIGCKAGILC